MAETVESNSKQYIYDNTVIHVDRKFENDTPIGDILKQYIWENYRKIFCNPEKVCYNSSCNMAIVDSTKEAQV